MKFTLLIHIISWILALVITLLTPENGFVRYDANIICWGLVFFSALLLFILNIIRKSWKISVCYALIALGTGFALLLYSTLFRSPRVAESSHYVVRHIIPGFGIDGGYFWLYEKDGLWEKLHSDLACDEIVYNLKDFQEYEKWGAVSFCLELKETWKKEMGITDADSCTSYYVQVIDKEKAQPHIPQINELGIKLNAKKNY